LGEVHLVIFGFTFVLIVLFVPGGLMSISQKILSVLKYPGRNHGTAKGSANPHPLPNLPLEGGGE